MTLLSPTTTSWQIISEGAIFQKAVARILLGWASVSRNPALSVVLTKAGRSEQRAANSLERLFATSLLPLAQTTVPQLLGLETWFSNPKYTDSKKIRRFKSEFMKREVTVDEVMAEIQDLEAEELREIVRRSAQVSIDNQTKLRQAFK